MKREKTGDAIAPPAADAAADFDAQKFCDRLGPLMQGRDLWKVLGYPSSKAMVMARRRGTVPVTLFEIPSRRGVFAYTEEVARWVANVRQQGASRETQGGRPDVT